MKVVTYIEPVSIAKVAALLGILWAVLGWLMGGIVITLLARSGENVAGLPPSFSWQGILSGIIGGCIVGGISGYLGAHAYNVLAQKVGGIRAEVAEV